jgi:membrane-bound ClpP family serine protease
VIFLLNPDVAFVFLCAALLMTIFALLSPGTGFLEALALALLVAVGYTVANLPVNAWALVVLLLGIVAIIVTFRRVRKWYYMAGSIVLLIVGMIFVFRGEYSVIGVNPLIAVIGSIGLGAFIWIVGSNISKTFHQKPYSDLNRLEGMTGKAITDISDEGSVYVDGENWSATSENPIPAGSSIRVVQRNGLILKVEIDNKGN